MSQFNPFFYFIFIVYCSLPSLAQNTIIDHYTEGYGQNFRWVYDITQDDQGFLWFGTHTGLRRYDGNDFLVYQHSDKDTSSLSCNTIQRVTKDHSNNIWAYGIDQVFNKMDLTTGRFVKTKSFFKDDTLVTAPFPKMKHFKALNNGDFIVMFQHIDSISNGRKISLWKYNTKRNGFDHLMDVPTQGVEINYFTEGREGILWLWGMGKGYYLVDLNNKKIVNYPIGDKAIISPDKAANPIDENRNFWYPSNFHENENQPVALKSFRIPENIDVLKIERISPDNLGNIWFYEGETNLYHFDTQTEVLEKFAHPMFRKSKGVQIMYNIFVDQEGAYWNGHFFGAVRFKNQPDLFKEYLDESPEEGLENGAPFSSREIIELSPTKLLVKENEHHLFIVDLGSQKTTKVNLKPGTLSIDSFKRGFHAIAFRSDGYLWMNQSDKLIKLNIETGRIDAFDISINNSTKASIEDPFNKYVPRLFEDASRNLWWCDPKGLFIFDEKTEKLNPVRVAHLPQAVNADFKYSSYDPTEDAIYGVYSNRENKGIYVVNCNNKSVKLLDVFSENEGYDILITSILKWKNEFWLSTNKGLIRYNPETKIRNSYTIKDGLPSNIIFSALGGEKYIWLGTKKGLCQFDPFNMQMAVFFKEQGLPFNEFNIGSSLVMSDGEMYFGGENGVVGFDPKDFTLSKGQNGQFNLVNIFKYNQNEDTYTEVLNLPYSPTETIIIHPDERTITFKYMLAKYDDVNKNQYFHYLEGLDKDWINDGDHNEARYLQIPPGKYTFHAKAKGPYKVPALNEIVIPVIVKQYWYLRWWAIVCYFILITSALILLYRIQLNRKLFEQEAYRIRELDDLKTKMYTNITHEFRTPLTVILGMNDAIKEYSSEGYIEKVNDATKMIDRNGKSLLQLVNQMLELSKLESGKMKIYYQHGNIVAYLKYLLESFQSYAEEKGVQIHFLSQKDEIMMDYDVEKISYIVGNLLSNAIKFTFKNGSIYLDIRQHIDANGRSYLVLKVKDTGIGIEASEIAHVFNRFYQVDDSHTRNGEGTGIGLSLAQELVKLLKGTIEIRSEINKGSEFIVTLPITRMADDISTQHFNAKEELLDGSFNTDLNDEPYLNQDHDLPLVLIVEDNVDVSHYIESRIKDNYQVVKVNDGKKGIEMAMNLIPDIVISDVMMPLVDGLELCGTLKKDERTSHIPIILLTGKSGIDSKIEGLEQGADAYLEKPFNSKELLIRLKNLLSLRAKIQKRYSESDFTQPIYGLSETENNFLSKIRSVVLEHISEEEFDIKQLCKLMYLSRTQLHRKLIALTGESTSNLIRKIQLEKAKELLALGEHNVSEVAYQVGFKTQAHFSRVFSEAFGIPPSSFRK